MLLWWVICANFWTIEPKQRSLYIKCRGRSRIDRLAHVQFKGEAFVLKKTVTHVVKMSYSPCGVRLFEALFRYEYSYRYD